MPHDSDHDLLIRVDQKVTDLIKQVGTLTDDHEKRIRALERMAWVWSGASAVLGSGLTMLVNYFLK